MDKTRMIRLLLTMICVLSFALLSAHAQDDAPQQTDPQDPAELFVGSVAAPDFPPDIDWLNVDNPLTLDGLQGKVVVLDFWTYGCINCIHMIPVLDRLEQKYAEELVVIGVHSAKFDKEGETENIRQIVQRYDVRHPVINDSDFRVWRTYNVRAWPTFAIIDPRGNVVAMQSGEIPYEAFDQYLGAMIDYYDSLGTDEIDRTPLDLALEGAGDPGTPLLFPGKVLADAENNRLFIADTNHNRIVVADLDDYEVQQIIGNGGSGLNDGDYETATFDKPHGMTVQDNVLYVADTNNHAIRRVDLNAQTVETVAGTGNKGGGLLRFGQIINDPLNFELRSPWDVELVGDTLHIAMAGTHQLWMLDLATNTMQVSVGNGREAQFNDMLGNSELAQPSGLHYHEGQLYFADSESSTIRVADFRSNRVRVASGTTNNSLFEFGDVDGPLGESLLQHALGITGTPDGSQFFIADTYNNKIKRYNPDDNTTETLFGLDGNGGFRDGGPDAAQFDEPGGLDYANGLLYVADTNNHAIRVIDLDANTVSSVQFPNVEALRTERSTVTIVGGNSAAGETITLDPQTVAAGAGSLDLTLTLPDGYKINDLTDSTLSVTGEAVQLADGSATIEIEEVTASIPATFSAGEGTVSMTLTVFYCEAENEAVCLIDEVTIDAPLTVSDDADDSTLDVARVITLPELYSGGL